MVFEADHVCFLYLYMCFVFTNVCVGSQNSIAFQYTLPDSRELNTTAFFLLSSTSFILYIFLNLLFLLHDISLLLILIGLNLIGCIL